MYLNSGGAIPNLDTKYWPLFPVQNERAGLTRRMDLTLQITSGPIYFTYHPEVGIGVPFQARIVCMRGNTLKAFPSDCTAILKAEPKLAGTFGKVAL